jgi:hypothetical protein
LTDVQPDPTTTPADSTPVTPDATTQPTATPGTSAQQILDDRSSSITWRGTWRRVHASSAEYGNTITYSGLAGSTASFRFVGKSLDVIGATGTSRGWLQVWVNGHRAATVDLAAAGEQDGVSVFSHEWSRHKARTIVLRVIGTAERPRVDLDAVLLG